MRPKLGVGVAKDPGEKFFIWGTFGQAEWYGRVASYMWAAMWAAQYGGSAWPPRSCVFGRFGWVEEVPISWRSRFKPSSLFSLGRKIFRERHSGRAFAVVFSHLRYSIYKSSKPYSVNFLFGFPRWIECNRQLDRPRPIKALGNRRTRSSICRWLEFSRRRKWA
jgi:hypothetical protein